MAQLFTNTQCWTVGDAVAMLTRFRDEYGQDVPMRVGSGSVAARVPGESPYLTGVQAVWDNPDLMTSTAPVELVLLSEER